MTLTQTIRTSVPGPIGTRRLFAAASSGLADHFDRFGPMPADFDAGHLIAELEASGLSGRGGAAFPTWRKLMAAAHATTPAARSPRRAAAVVVANGAEGEPLSRKDETLLRVAPHLVLDGLLLAAATVRAADVVLYAPVASLGHVTRAVAQRRDAAAVRLVEAPDIFLSGEATAVVRAVGGGPALPRDHTQRLTESGLGGRPTLVQNVETLAHLALLARFGADWFRSVGTADEPGTRLVTVSGDVGAPRVLEVPGGLPIAETLRVCDTAPTSLRAVLVGGYHGAWVSGDRLDTPLSASALAPFGASPGAGIVMALGSARCGLTASAEIVAYLAGQSARQCGPCANGLPRLAEVLTRLAARDRAPWLPAEVERLARIVVGRGSCHHPDGTSRFVLSTLTVFSDDVAAHLAGRCRAEQPHFERRIGVRP